MGLCLVDRFLRDHLLKFNTLLDNHWFNFLLSLFGLWLLLLMHDFVDGFFFLLLFLSCLLSCLCFLCFRNLCAVDNFEFLGDVGFFFFLNLL